MKRMLRGTTNKDRIREQQAMLWFFQHGNFLTQDFARVLGIRVNPDRGTLGQATLDIGDGYTGQRGPLRVPAGRIRERRGSQTLVSCSRGRQERAPLSLAARRTADAHCTLADLRGTGQRLEHCYI